MNTSPVRKMTGHLRNGQNMRIGVIADKLSLKRRRFLMFLYVVMRLTYPFQYLFIKLQSNFSGSNTFGTIKLVRDRGSSSQ